MLNIDASGDGLGAVLYQEHYGEECVIAYASRGLRASKCNYPTLKVEFLALKWAVCDKFNDYLHIVLQKRSPKVTCTHTGRVTSSIIHHFKAQSVLKSELRDATFRILCEKKLLPF